MKTIPRIMHGAIGHSNEHPDILIAWSDPDFAAEQAALWGKPLQVFHLGPAVAGKHETPPHHHHGKRAKPRRR